MFNYNNNKVTNSFYKEIIATKERIKVKSGKCRYNYKCHMNAVHEAVKNKHSKLAMVVYMDEGKVNPIIHFLNFDGENYIDNTLGEWTQRNEYYLIRYIGEEDFWNIGYIFTSYRETIKNNRSWWLKLTSDVNF